MCERTLQQQRRSFSRRGEAPEHSNEAPEHSNENLSRRSEVFAQSGEAPEHFNEAFSRSNERFQRANEHFNSSREALEGMNEHGQVADVDAPRRYVYTGPMKKAALVALLLGIQGCGPSVEVVEVGVTEGRPRPNACIAGEVPKFVPVERQQIVPAPAALGPIVLDPKTNRVVVIGGLKSSGVYSKRISALDIVSYEHHVMSLEGDTVELPAFGAAIWDAENDQAVVIGGTAGGADLEQIFSVRIHEGAAIVKRLPDFPIGSIFQPAAAYDPIGKRVIVVAYIHAQDAAMELAYRGTYTLDLKPGAESWSTLVSGEAGPPQVQSGGETRQMVYDPVGDRMILAASGTGSIPGGAFTLDLRSPKQWIGLSGTLPTVPVGSPALVWDEVSCSFLYFTRKNASCGFDAWRIDVGTSEVASSPIGNLSFGKGGPEYGSLFFDMPRDRLLNFGWGDCVTSDSYLDTVDLIGIKR